MIEIFAVLIALFIMAFILQGAAWPDRGEAAGTRQSAARRAKLLASVMLGFAGGVAGVLLSYFFALITNTSSTETVVFYMHFGQASNMAFPLWMALEAVGISSFIGLLAGALTARTSVRERS